LDSDNFFSVPLEKIVPDTPLPFKIYLYINNHFVLYRNVESELEENAYTRLQLKKVQFVFIEDAERSTFEKYDESTERINEEAKEVLETPVGQITESTKKELQKAAEYGPLEENMQEITTIASNSSQRLVEELKNQQYAADLLSKLVVHSNGIYGHSTNVATIAIHVALKMGYRQRHMLEYIGSAGLLHDIGKIKINKDLLNRPPDYYTTDEKIELEKHPRIGRELLLAITGSPEEVRLMVYQHHENYDGSGYPQGLRGQRIYEPTKIVSAINIFERLFQATRGISKKSSGTSLELLLKNELTNRIDQNTANKILTGLKDFF